MKPTRGRVTWMRRLSFAAVLALAVLTPGQAPGWSAQLCRRSHCETAGTVRWARALPGSWVARGGLAGTTPVAGQAFVALSAQVAVAGAGLTVSAYDAGSGRELWTDRLTGFPAGSAIVAVRAWPGVITVGVAVPGPARARRAGAPREEIVLRAGTGERLGVYPAAAFGGAVAAGAGETVIMGVRSVTSYSNRTGRVLWTQPTGAAPQAWQADRGRLYVTVAPGGYLGGAPVTGLRRIDLRNGQQRLVRPIGRSYAGTLSLAFDGVVLFSSAGGVTAYSGTTGELLWRRPGALPDAVDAAARRIYLIKGNQMLGTDPVTGAVLARVPGAASATSSGLYAVREGAVLGLDHGALGKAWGYNVAAREVVWTSRPLPWPHFFVDLSGIGGSASPARDAVLLAVCAQLGQPVPGSAVQRCARPQLVLLNR